MTGVTMGDYVIEEITTRSNGKVWVELVEYGLQPGASSLASSLSCASWRFYVPPQAAEWWRERLGKRIRICAQDT